MRRFATIWTCAWAAGYTHGYREGHRAGSARAVNAIKAVAVPLNAMAEQHNNMVQFLHSAVWKPTD